MTRIVKILAFVLVLSSCRTLRTSSDVRRSDSVSYVDRLVVRDSLVLVPVPADSSILQALIECDSLNQAHIRYIVRLEDGTRSSIAVTLDNNLLSVACQCDSLAIYSLYHSRYQQLAESAISHSGEVKATARSGIPMYIYVLIVALTAISVFLSINSILNHVQTKRRG